MRDLAFDPRNWNLFAGVTLAVAGCGDRVVGADDGKTVTTNTQADTSSETGSDPECITDSDCPNNYYECVDQVCHYIGGHHDGSFDLYEYDCFADYECGVLEQCYFNYCQPISRATDCFTDLPQPTPLPIPGQALGLSFADVDGDGVAELVVATSTELHVFASGVDTPTTSARVDISDSVDAMVGGQFDMDPGQDVMLHFGGTQSLHSSDGGSGLLPPTTLPNPIGVAFGLLAGDFDQQPPDEVLMWGAGGARVEGGLVSMVLTDSPQVSAAVAGPAGFTVSYTDNGLEFFDFDGVSSWTGTVASAAPHPLFASAGQVTLSASSMEANNGVWALFQAWDPAISNSAVSQFGFAGAVSLMRRGDFDGGGVSDIAMIANDGLWLHLNVLDGVGECYVRLNTGGSEAVALSVGDHDGDGDDELAVLLADASVLVFDGETP